MLWVFFFGSFLALGYILGWIVLFRILTITFTKTAISFY
ncbi:hypothetical protein H0185_19745 [Mesobacillus maritimus]|uniref:Uncharacterized protein n=1 Tax=Mesobacillus maritimus TaxID=1643336 RepID=A0ABS7K9Q8_9BACI|nr:hypothetical protein [Mesobacillus maritimus]